MQVVVDGLARASIWRGEHAGIAGAARPDMASRKAPASFVRRSALILLPHGPPGVAAPATAGKASRTRQALQRLALAAPSAAVKT